MAKPQKKLNDLPEPSELLEQLSKQSVEIDQSKEDWAEFLNSLKEEIDEYLDSLNSETSDLEEYIDHE